MLNDKREDGEYKIPFLVVCDAFQSETTAFADLVLPDTTYLERHDVMSMLDRPISEFDGPIDSVRVPVVPPTGRVQAVPGRADRARGAAQVSRRSSTPDGTRKFRDYPDFIVNYETEPGSGIGFLSGWRGKDGDKFMRGEPNPKQWEMYAQNNCVYHHPLPPSYQYMRNWNRGYMEWAQRLRIRRYTDPVVIQIYSEVLQKFRLAAQGKGADASRRRICASAHRHLLRSAAVLVRAARSAATDLAEFPLNAVTQRPMAMYHSWDSQNAWLRQIHAHNHLFVNPKVARAAGIDDGGWMWVESPWGKVRCLCSYSEAVEPGTVWTWNAIGKAPGAWRLVAGRQRIAARIPAEPPDLGRAARRRNGARRCPIRIRSPGRPAWYDVRVRIRKRRSGRAEGDVAAIRGGARRRRAPATTRRRWQAFFAGGAEGHDPARARHRSQRLRRLPRLRDELQGVEHVGLGGAARRPQSVRQGSDRRVLQPRADVRGRRISEHADRALPEVVPALRGSAVRARVPDRRELQARRGRHRARRLRQVHRLQVLRVGVPVRRARARRQSAR